MMVSMAGTYHFPAEIFNSNISRVTSFLEQSFNLKNPGATPAGKASVGVLA